MTNEIEKELVVNKLTGDVKIDGCRLYAETKRYMGKIIIKGKEYQFEFRRDYYTSEGDAELEFERIEGYNDEDYANIVLIIKDWLDNIEDWGDYE